MTGAADAGVYKLSDTLALGTNIEFLYAADLMILFYLLKLRLLML